VCCFTEIQQICSTENQALDFLAKLKGDGSFEFRNLPVADFSIYALKDAGMATVIVLKNRMLGFFLTLCLNTAATNTSINLFVYAQEKVADNKVIRAALNLYKATKFTSNLSG
jgi:hypothetical protein